MRRRLNGKSLGVRTVCGVKIPIVRATVEQASSLIDDDGASLDGVFDTETMRIYVRDGQSPEGEQDTINHEILHALLLLSGAKAFIAKELRTPAKEYEIEEVLVRILTPHVAAIRWATGGKK